MGEEHEDIQVWISWSLLLPLCCIHLASETMSVLSSKTPCCASHPSSNYSKSPAVKTRWSCCADPENQKHNSLEVLHLLSEAFSVQAYNTGREVQGHPCSCLFPTQQRANQHKVTQKLQITPDTILQHSSVQCMTPWRRKKGAHDQKSLCFLEIRMNKTYTSSYTD